MQQANYSGLLTLLHVSSYILRYLPPMSSQVPGLEAILQMQNDIRIRISSPRFNSGDIRLVSSQVDEPNKYHMTVEISARDLLICYSARLERCEGEQTNWRNMNLKRGATEHGMECAIVLPVISITMVPRT